MLKKTALAILATLAVSAPAQADFADGWAAYEAGNYAAALDNWLPLAERGDLDALYDVAALYESGVLGKPQFGRAVAFYRRAAERRMPAAQTRLGRMFETGEGVEANPEKSIDWYRKAAERGVAEAQYNLAVAYERGAIVAPDVGLAGQLYRQAADQGLAPAQYNLGRLYYHGEGVPKDMALAIEWYERAADAGFAPAQTNLGHMYENGIHLARDIDAAKGFYRRAAEQGFATAQTNLGILLSFGVSQNRDYNEAFRWFLAASLQGDIDAQTNLALMFANGMGVERNIVEAYAWLTVAMGGPPDAAETARAYRERLIKRFIADEAANGEARAAALRGELSKVESIISLAQPRETAGFGMPVLTIQRRLATLGHYASIVDSLIGPASREAIRAFQKVAGLKIDGRATKALITALDAAVAALKSRP